MLYAIAFDFACNLGFNKIQINYKDFEFVFHNGGQDHVDVIETILTDLNEKNRFVQTTIEFCLAIAIQNSCGFTYITEFGLGNVGRGFDLYNKLPSIRLPRHNRTLSVNIHNIKKLDSQDKLIIAALFNDAEYTTNHFFKFLCYWKILETPINGRNRNAKDYINDLITRNPTILNSKLALLYDSGVDIGNHLKEKYRNAITHISRPPFLSTHDYKDYVDVVIMTSGLFEFVKYFINNDITWHTQSVNILRNG